MSNTRKSVSSNIQTLRSWLKSSAAPRFFNSLLGVWMSDETLFLVFDIFHARYNHHVCIWYHLFEEKSMFLYLSTEPNAAHHTTVSMKESSEQHHLKESWRFIQTVTRAVFLEWHHSSFVDESYSLW